MDQKQALYAIPYNISYPEFRLQRHFTARGPNQKWVSDISYIKTNEGWLYLVVFIDLYSRRVVGWSADKHMRVNLVNQALLQSLWLRKPTGGLIIHTDQGSQYIADSYHKILKTWHINSSMSRRGNCWDNSVAESFFASIKKHRVYDNKVYETRKRAWQDIADYIGFYNYDRLHSTNDYVSPVDYEKTWKDKFTESQNRKPLCTKKC